jgi:alpha-tubulin suppressor-like RCC1 family protein
LNTSLTFNTPILIPLLFNITDIACGIGFSLVLNSIGNVYAFGYNQNGQLGLNNTIDTIFPTLVNGVKNITKLIVGLSSMLIDINLNIYGCGLNLVTI